MGSSRNDRQRRNKFAKAKFNSLFGNRDWIPVRPCLNTDLGAQAILNYFKINKKRWHVVVDHNYLLATPGIGHSHPHTCTCIPGTAPFFPFSPAAALVWPAGLQIINILAAGWAGYATRQQTTAKTRRQASSLPVNAISIWLVMPKSSGVFDGSLTELSRMKSADEFY